MKTTTLAAKNNCLAQSNKSRTGVPATNNTESGFISTRPNKQSNPTTGLTPTRPAGTAPTGSLAGAYVRAGVQREMDQETE